MRNGYLNKAELAKVERCYRDLDGLLSKLPLSGLSKPEESTYQNLVDARNKCSDLLWWQAPERAQAIRKEKEGA